MSQPPKTTSSRLASGTNSLIFGERFSVRLPRRMWPICVSEPMGCARPLRMAMTPAMVVVLTAPSPTRRIPSFPSAGAISEACFTLEIYHLGDAYHGRMMFLVRMLMRRGRGPAMDPLQVSMTGVRMGERFLQIGCHDRSLLSGLAAKVGLSGTAAVAAFNDEQARRAASIGVKVGALIEVQ